MGIIRCRYLISMQIHSGRFYQSKITFFKRDDAGVDIQHHFSIFNWILAVEYYFLIAQLTPSLNNQALD